MSVLRNKYLQIRIAILVGFLVHALPRPEGTLFEVTGDPEQRLASATAGAFDTIEIEGGGSATYQLEAGAGITAPGTLLTDAGARVREAYDGDAGPAALTEAECDVVLLDIRMPGKDGITVLKAIKVAHPVVEVILLTGHGTIDTAVEGLKSGAFDYVQKPARFEDLLDKLEAARKRKSEHEGRIRRAEARSLMR